MSSANTKEEEEETTDCPLCLSPLSSYDHTHPIQCPSNHCHFNSCLDCLESMIKATKDEGTEASDGNFFRVFLHCPNCRSNLGPSIRDTVLLRKVDKKYSHHDDGGGGGLHNNEDDELTLSTSERRFKNALEKDDDVKVAVENAQNRENEFFGSLPDATNTLDDYFLGSSIGSFGRGESIWSFDDEEGVEADINIGPHKSFVFRHHSQINLMKDAKRKEEEALQLLKNVKPDSTLLIGLDAFMTEQEQKLVTSQMVSGDISKLAAATETMHYVGALAKQGIKPSLQRKNSSNSMMLIVDGIGEGSSSNINGGGGKRSSVLASIKEVIRGGNEARRIEEERRGRGNNNTPVGVVATHLLAETFAGGRRKEKKAVDMEMKQQIQYMKLHPLPLRMPKYVEAGTDCKRLTFLDDNWDGTVLDAYSKITVSKSLLTEKVTITKQHAESSGIRRVIDALPSAKKSKNRKGQIDIQRPRVLIGSINREMGQQGVVKGDVVSHFNGEEFNGTAMELKELIGNKYEGEVMTFCFNADLAVAEALKRRSMITE